MAIGKKTKVKTFCLAQQSRKQRLAAKNLRYTHNCFQTKNERPTKSNLINTVWLNVKLWLYGNKNFHTFVQVLLRFEAALTDTVKLRYNENTWDRHHLFAWSIHFGPKSTLLCLRYNQEFVTTAFFKTEIDCIFIFQNVNLAVTYTTCEMSTKRYGGWRPLLASNFLVWKLNPTSP